MKWFSSKSRSGWAVGLPWQNPGIVSTTQEKTLDSLYNTKWYVYEHYEWVNKDNVHVFCLDKVLDGKDADDFRPHVEVNLSVQGSKIYVVLVRCRKLLFGNCLRRGTCCISVLIAQYSVT